MNTINQKLAYGLWAVSGISIIIYIVDYIPIMYDIGEIYVIIPSVLAAFFQFFLGYHSILRDNNDKLTMISVIMITLFRIDFTGIVAIVLRLLLRQKRESETIRNVWFVPAIVSGVLGLITLFTAFRFVYLVKLTLNAVYYLIFGYWFIKYLKVN